MVDPHPCATLERVNARDVGSQFGGEHVAADPGSLDLSRLAALPSLAYQAERKEVAAALEISVGALDKAVADERAQRRAEAARTHLRRPPGPGEVRWPPGWSMKAEGLYGTGKDDGAPLWLTGPFEILGETRDRAGEEWGILLRWRDGDGTSHLYTMPHALVMAEPGRLEAELVRRGLRVSADAGARVALRRGLSEVRAGNRVRVAYVTGWQGDATTPTFLLPNGEVVGIVAEPVVLHNPAPDAAQRCATLGTLDGWKADVAALAVGNPFPAFCVSAGFAGPLLQQAGDAGGGVHFFGGSKRGKTLAMQMALSAWALPYKAGGALRDWGTTANALEAAAEECTDGLLALDELHRANPAELSAACYMLADGAGKGRLRRDASAARRRTWRVFVLSSGEHDLATAAARAGQKLPAGADVRLASIPVEGIAQAWPNLHGRADLPTLAADIHKAMRQHHGTAARAFVERLAEMRAADPASLANRAEEMRDRFAARLPKNADPQVSDVARRCALVAAAGELAASWGILPWPVGEAENAAAAMLAGWLARRVGGAGAAEPASQLECVRAALVQHGSGRFTVLSLSKDGRWHEAHPDRPVHNRIGWRKRDGTRDEFLIPPETWRAEVCAPVGLDPTATVRTLDSRGFLRRGEGRNLSVKERLPGCPSPMRVYAVKADLLEAPTDDAEAGTA